MLLGASLCRCHIVCRHQLCAPNKQAAAGCLEALGALEPRSGRLTERGRAMARLPVTPRHARMLLRVGHPSALPCTCSVRVSGAPDDWHLAACFPSVGHLADACAALALSAYGLGVGQQAE